MEKEEINIILESEEGKKILKEVIREEIAKSTFGAPFINGVELFNKTMGKVNNYSPIIPKDKKEWMFVYDFILEETREYRQSCEVGDIVGVLDALCDLAYVAVGNLALLHGIKDKFPQAFAEVQASNMSKACKSQEEAEETIKVRSLEQGEDCHWEKHGEFFIVYRSRDRKVLKNINYFFTEDEINQSISV